MENADAFILGASLGVWHRRNAVHFARAPFIWTVGSAIAAQNQIVHRHRRVLKFLVRTHVILVLMWRKMETKQTLTVVGAAMGVVVQKYAFWTVIARQACVLKTHAWVVTILLKMETKQI
tara:strand:- start:2717 stop:3076 length:360 start_codon:yes stop_codon:yes gene_type:complete